MATAALTELPLTGLAADPQIVHVVQSSVSEALKMCGTEANCVGISSIPSAHSGGVTGVIGVHGNVSGFVHCNVSERFAIKAVEGLLQDKFDELNSQVVDGVGEITNIIVGGIKAGLASTDWAVSNITVPSVIVGKGYQFAYARGLNYLCVTFEHNDDEAFMLNDRLMQVSISLLRL